MNLALWIVTGVLAFAYVAGGSAKVIMSQEKIAASGHSARWVEDFRPGTIKAIGVLEVLGGLGLVLPAVFGVAQGLVPLAALGLVMIMAGATVTRIARREFKLMLADLAYLALTGFVAWGRFGPEAFVG